MSSDMTTTVKMEYSIESDTSDLTTNVDSKPGPSSEKPRGYSSLSLRSRTIKPETVEYARNVVPEILFHQNIPTKRKHNTLSLETKMEVIQRLENGESAASLAQIYDVGRATIFDIKSKKDKILQFASKFKNESALKDRKTLRKGKRTFLEAENFDKETSNSSVVSEDKSASKHEEVKEEVADANESNVSSSPIPCERDPSTSCENNLIVCSSPGGSNSSVREKRKHNVLPLETKLEIIHRLEKGESITSLAPIYNVGRATVFDIKNKKDSILAFAAQMKSGEDLKTRKTMRKANDAPLEEALYLWYVQRLSQGHAVTGPFLCEKALELNANFGGPSDFKASSGWLKNFRARYGIKLLPSERQSTVAVTAPVDNSFLEAYLNLLQQEGYSVDDIYTADKIEVNLNSMPRKSFIFQHESEDTRKSLESVTILMCANSNWNHALPLLMIGKSPKEKCFRNISCLPVIYWSQKDALMTPEIFADWYVNEFITAVKKVRNNNSKQGKVLLLLHNADFLSNAEALNAVDENFQIMTFPENVTPLVHSMDQTVIKKLKKMFKVQVLTRLLLTSHYIEDMAEYAKRITLKHFCYMLADTWGMLAEEKMKEEWKKLWGLEAEDSDKNDPLCSEKELKEISEMCKSIPGLSKCDREDIRIWINSDNDSLTTSSSSPVHTEEVGEIITPVPTEDIITAEKDGSNTAHTDQQEDNFPLNTEALDAFETAIEWCEQQKECFPEQLILLKRLKDLCAKKSSSKYAELKTLKDM